MSNDSLREIDKILDEVEFNMFTAPRNELQKRVAELEAENARLRQQRDAANAQLDWLIEQTGTKRVTRSNMDECE